MVTLGILVDMNDYGSSRLALPLAIITGLLLLGLYVLFERYIGFADMQVPTLLTVSVYIVIVLASYVVYLLVNISSIAHSIADGIIHNTIRYTHELFTEVYQGGPVPYVIVNNDGRIESMNRAALRLFEVKEGVLSGTSIFDRIEHDESVRVGLLGEYLKQGLALSDEEARIIRRDGAHRWVLISLFSFSDSERRHKGLMTFVDITKQKQVDIAKSEFVSLASHQLRTPITTMKWNTELLLTATPEGLSAAQMGYYDKIVQGLNRMDMLVTDFLNVSKFELGTLSVDRGQLELTVLAQEILDEQRLRAETRSIHIEEVWGERPYPMVSDSHLLHMILSNLLSNAVKYTRDGGVVRFQCSRDNGNTTIIVADTGIGIPLDEQDQIFSKIFRASNARTQVGEGTGLGLYIVREAVHVLGGEISFVSEVDIGTTFTVVLPD